MANALAAILYGSIGSVIAVVLVALFARTGPAMRLLGSTYRLAHSMRVAGLSKFHLSRDDYEGTLRTYLSKAKHSIGVISISLKQTHEEGDLVNFFRTRLAQDPSFRIRVSLIAPLSDAAKCAAESLDFPLRDLQREVGIMLSELLKLKDSLTRDQQQRLDILVHECLPMGSAILLDASPEAGTIQIETKLHRTPRVDSFGFEIVGPSEFYERHYRAWSAVFDESRPPRNEELDSHRSFT